MMEHDFVVGGEKVSIFEDRKGMKYNTDVYRTIIFLQRRGREQREGGEKYETRTITLHSDHELDLDELRSYVVSSLRRG